jgi:hypothetical protein
MSMLRPPILPCAAYFNRYLVLLVFLVLLALSVEAANTTVTPPDTAKVGWIHEPDGRGTWGIIWSCLFTWFICLWQVVQLNAPEVREKERAWYIRKIGCFALGAVAPELIVTMAFTQRRNAQAFVEGMRQMRRGWQLPAANLPASAGDDIALHETIMRVRALPDEYWTMHHGFYCIMGGYAVRLFHEGRETFFPVNECQFLWLVQHGVIDLPEISAEEIKDKSKADSLIKTIAGLQAAWFILQCIGRAAQKLSTATLEITTVAYVICISPALCFWWNKPVDVKVPTILHVRRWDNNVTESLDKLDPLSRQRFWRDRPKPEVLPTRATNTVEIDGSLGHNKDYFRLLPNWYVLVSVAVTYGAIHCIAWNFSFVSVFESWAWRGCTLFIILVSFLTALNFSIWHIMEYSERRRKLALVIQQVCCFFYILARLYLLVEAFIAFRSMPAEVYQSVDWLKYFPYV